jgi:hypothetical protein
VPHTGKAADRPRLQRDRLGQDRPDASHGEQLLVRGRMVHTLMDALFQYFDLMLETVQHRKATEKLAALVPLPRVHLVRYAGCLAPHSKLREALIPTPRQQGVDGEEAQPGTPSWSWARLLGRVFALDMAT